MWRKRASYDPMKAAAEGKKKQDLARRSSQQSKYCDNRCESFAFLCYLFVILEFTTIFCSEYSPFYQNQKINFISFIEKLVRTMQKFSMPLTTSFLSELCRQSAIMYIIHRSHHLLRVNAKCEVNFLTFKKSTKV